MIRLMDGVRGAGLEQGTNGRVSKEKVNEMMEFFNKAFWEDAVLSVWWFDKKLVEAVKESDSIIKRLLQSELERDHRYELNVSINNIQETIEWIDIINNNQVKNGWIIWKQFRFTATVIEGLLAFLKIYQSSNSISQNDNGREKEIILVLIVKALKYAVGSGRNGFTGIKSDLFSKFEEALHRVFDDADIGADETTQLVFQSSEGSYGNVPQKNKWIEDFIRSVSGDGWNILVHILKRTQVNKDEILIYLERNIIEVIIEYGTNFIFILSNSREWKKEEVVLYKTNEKNLENPDDRLELEKIIRLFLLWGVPYNPEQEFKIIRKSKISSQSMLAENEFYTSLQTITYQGV